MADDRHRPRVHFLPPRGWMNDPNGLIHVGGEYHLFFQHNPVSPWWGKMIWGHAVSTDLVRWKDLPHGLCPDEPYDAGGVWSGCAVNHDGTPTIVYTGVAPQCQCLATSDDMVHWRKHPANPVIASPPAELRLTTDDFRDPYVWRQGKRWRMVVGSVDRGRYGAVLLYESKDLVHWTYRGILARGDGKTTGRVWECPNFFRLGRKWVLIVSPTGLGRSIYFTGTLRGTTFTPELRGEIDPGGCLYAPQTFADAAGRRILFGWLWERRSRRAVMRSGWAGVMSLPRVVTLGRDGRLRFAPAAEVETLRRHPRTVAPHELEPNQTLVQPALAGPCVEIAAELDAGRAERVGLSVRRSPRGAEQTVIAYDRPAGVLRIDTTRSSTGRAPVKDVHETPLALARAEPLGLRVFIDASVVEVFANGRACLTGRVYPTGRDSARAAVFARGGPARVVSLEAWDLRP